VSVAASDSMPIVQIINQTKCLFCVFVYVLMSCIVLVPARAETEQGYPDFALESAGPDPCFLNDQFKDFPSASLNAPSYHSHNNGFSFQQSEDSSPHEDAERSSWRENLRLSGLFDVYGSMHLQKNDDNEQLKSLFQRIRAEARYTFRSRQENGFDFFPSPDPYLVLSIQSDFLWFGRKNSYSDHDLDLYEAYINWDEGAWQLRLGKQNVRWGKTDQVSPVDNLNAQDMRRFMLAELEDRKLPNWMARIRYFQDQWSLEGVFIPFFQSHELEYFGTNWAVFRHARQDIQDSDLPKDFRNYVRNIRVREDKPANTLRNAGFGARLAATFKDVDLAVSWLATRDPMPGVSSFPIDNLDVDSILSLEDVQDRLDQLNLTPGDIEVGYPRTRIYGLEFETVLGEYGLRGEAAFFDRQSFLQSDLTSVRKEVLHAVLGMDYTSEQNWYINLQLSDQVIFDYQDEILFFNRHNVSAMGEISREWARGDWETGLKGVYFLSDKSSHMNPYITHTPIDSLDITLGLHLFHGARDTVLGQYRNNDQAYLRLQYYF